jgi:ubiquinone/menaquinone biosynthesis C-methylase UbiE
MERITAMTLATMLVVSLAGAGEPGEPAKPRQHGHDHDHDHDATIDHRFDDVQRWVERFDDPERDAWQQPARVVEWLGIEPGATVADIGAGTGYFSVHLARRVGPDGKVFAVDVEPNLVEHMKTRFAEAGLSWAEARLTEPDDPGLPEGTVGLVLICNTWHHIDDRVDYLGRLARALGPGGRVAIVDFRKEELPVGPPPEHKMSRDEVVAEFAEAGWELSAEHTDLPHQYLLVFSP